MLVSIALASNLRFDSLFICFSVVAGNQSETFACSCGEDERRYFPS